MRTTFLFAALLALSLAVLSPAKAQQHVALDTIVALFSTVPVSEWEGCSVCRAQIPAASPGGPPASLLKSSHGTSPWLIHVSWTVSSVVAAVDNGFYLGRGITWSQLKLCYLFPPGDPRRPEWCDEVLKDETPNPGEPDEPGDPNEG